VRHPDASRHFLAIRAPDCAIVVQPAETSAARMRRATAWAIKMTNETTPLWVWLSVALLALGTLAYLTVVYLVDYIIGL
jgi:hypothetical protein